ncbi:MAG: Ig-like domain-containing protein [Myxococcota bacterium]
MTLALLIACDDGSVKLEDSTGTTPTGTTPTTKDEDPCACAEEAIDDEAFANYPPVVLCTTPRAGAIDVDPATDELRVTFSKDMSDRSWSWVQVSDRTYPETTGDPYFETDRTTVLPVALEAGQTYVVWINYYDEYMNFVDADGNAAAPFQITFRTAGE